MKERNDKESYLIKDDISEEEGDLNDFFVLLHFAKERRWQFIFSFTLLTLSSVMAILSAKGIGQFVDSGISKKDLYLSLFWSSMVICFEGLRFLFLWGGRKKLAEASSFSILSIRKALFAHIHHLPLSYFDHQPQGRTVTRMTHDVESLEEFFSSGLGRFLNLFLMALISLIGMLFIDFKIGLIIILGVLPVIFLTLISRKEIKKINRTMSMRNSATNSKLSEFLNGISVIRTFGLEEWTQKKYDDVVDNHLNACLRANSFYGLMRPITSFLSMVPLIILIAWGGRQVIQGALAIGPFITFIRLCDNFARPIVDIMREIHLVQQAFTSAERIMSFLRAEKEESLLGKDGLLSIKDLKDKIVFKNIFMNYDDGQPVLRDVSFSVMAGEKIGLVGTTGSGKTSTMALLSRLYPFSSGEIYIDQFPIGDYQRRDIRRLIGPVSQEVILFSGSLRENLILDLDIRDQTIIDYAEKSGFFEVMKKNNLTLDSLIVEKGENLSVGERQLLALTRILLRNPPILVLDEATSNIDEESELKIQQAIDTVMKGRTCFIVAHRLKTLKKCDKIFIFENGKIIEEKKQSDWPDLNHYFIREKAAF